MSGLVGTSHSKSKVIGRSEDTAYAWCNFEGDGTPSFRRVFNCSSIQSGGSAGKYSLTFTTPIGSDGSCVSNVCDDLDAYFDNRGISVSNRNGGDGAGCKIVTFHTSDGTRADMSDISITVFAN